MVVITKRQIAFAAAYVFSFTALAAVGYCVGDYSVRTQVHKLEAGKVETADTAYYDLPHMNLTVTSVTGDKSHLRIDMSLEVSKADLARLDSYRPRITDRLTEYLRGQNIEDLRRASAEHIFKAQLLEETQKASYPVPIMDIVFRRFIVL
jgi:flagellar basal body-associated protein FliL